MPKGQNEVEKFFDGLPSEDEVRADPLEPEKKEGQAPEKEGNEPKPEQGEGRKNRRHRRLEQQLQQEREARIAAEARAEGQRDAQRGNAGSAGDNPPEGWLRIYGDTPESRNAWSVHKGLFAEQARAAKEEAVEEIRREEKARRDEQQKFESFIDSELEQIEDENDVDLTSDSPAARKARREFLELVAELSPKGEDGAISSYADFGAAWKVFKKGREDRAKDPEAERRRELASRGMREQGNAPEGGEPRKRTPGFYGWMQDIGK